jgi:hypothetical protein
MAGPSTTQAPTPRLTFPYPVLPAAAKPHEIERYLREFESQHRQWVVRLENLVRGIEAKLPVEEP